MGIYRTTILGRREPLLAKGDSANDIRHALIPTCDKLTANEVEAAYEGGGKLWKPGESLPVEPTEGTGLLADARFEAAEAFEAGALVMIGPDGKVYPASEPDTTKE